MKVFKLKKYLIIFILLLVCLNVSSQVYTFQNSIKLNFTVNSDENDSITSRIYQAAYDYSYFDEMRYLETRRIIKVHGYSANIVLFSAQELLDKYGKQISPLTTSEEIDSVIVEMQFDEVKHPAFKRYKLN